MYEKLRNEINEYLIKNKSTVLDFFSPFFQDEYYRDIELIKDDKLMASPIFLTHRQNSCIAEALNRTMEVLFRLPETYFEGNYEAYFDGIELGKEERELFYTFNDPKYCKQHEHYRLLARPDFIYDGNSIRIIEFNITSTLGGMVANDFLGEKAYKRFFQAQGLQCAEAVHPKVGDGFRKLFHRLAPKEQGKINVALAEWKEYHPEENVFLANFKRLMEEQNFNTFACDPTELAYKDGLVLGENPIDIVYRLFICGPGHLKPENRLGTLLKAVEHDKAQLFMFLTSRVFSMKSNLALLSAMADSGVLNTGDRRTVREFIPWTRILKEQRTLYKEESIDLVPYILKNKDAFVIKPLSMFGGKGVYVGCDHDQSRWESIVSEKVLNRDAIVQEYTAPFQMQLPVIDDKKRDVSIERLKCIFSTFMIDGKASGYFIRGQNSSVNIINGSLGALPTTVFLVDEQAGGAY